MKASISRAYAVLAKVVVQRQLAGIDIKSLEVECHRGDENVIEDERIFESHLDSLEAASVTDREALVEFLIRLRISAMNIENAFSNLADDIETVLMNIGPRES